VCVPIDEYNLGFSGGIGVDHRSREGNLERFGMNVEFGEVIQAFHAGGVDDGNATFLISTIGDIHSLFRRVVAHIVGIFSDIEACSAV